MSFVIFDTEFTADKGLLESGFDGWKNREIVQIAAIKVTSDLQVTDELNLYLKPEIHPYLSDYFVKLTGLTDSLIDEKGVAFPDGYRQFKLFAGNLVCYSHDWGNSKIADGEIMAEMLAHYKIYDNYPPCYKNIAPWFKARYEEEKIDIKSQASGEIAQLLGQEKALTSLGLGKHNALYDVYSILCGLRVLGFSDDGTV